MSDSGSTVGTPIVPSPGGPSGSAQQTLTLNTVPASSTLIPEQSVITLALYAHIINYHERPFFGVSAAGLDEDQCRNIWTKHQRDEIAYYLAEAQVEIENLAGMFLQPTYVYGLLSDEPTGDERRVDQRGYKPAIHTRWQNIIEFGKEAVAVVAEDASVVHTNDPAVIGPLPFTGDNVTADQFRVYHPGTDVVITPSSISIIANTVTFYIPRARMVLASLADTPEAGLSYDDTANFEATVDVKRVYTDTSQQATIVSSHSCSSACASSGCSEYTEEACVKVNNGRLGHIEVIPASYSGGVWTAKSCFTYSPERVRLYYRSGFLNLDMVAREAIVRLAHSKMPEEPCGCSVTQRLWERDRNIPEILTRERVNCPFGLSDGAWTAFQFATKGLKKFKAMVF